MALGLTYCGSVPELDEAGKAHMREKAQRSGGPDFEAYGHMSDEWVADRVRMLTRNDIDHEAICCASRDRIMRLTLKLEKCEIDRDAAVEQRDIQSRKARGFQQTVRLLAHLKSKLSSACHRLAHMNPSEEANAILAAVHLSRIELPADTGADHG